MFFRARACAAELLQVAFHPLAPNVLFVASRRSEKLLAFDTRNPSAPIMEYERPASTNQRLAFDVDPWGRWLAAGDEVSGRQSYNTTPVFFWFLVILG